MSHWDGLIKLARPYHNQFMRGAENPRETQKVLLQKILARNAESRFGRDYSFEKLETINDFRKHVPVTDYETIKARIGQMVAGHDDILTTERPIAFDLTSGTTSAAKLIPYTTLNLAAFRKALFTWIADLVAYHTQITKGRFYWALSPATGKRYETPSGIPVGPLNDIVFFGEEAASHLSALSVVPADLALETVVDSWRTRTLCHLLNATDLTLVSIWSPTFLISLLDHLHSDPEPCLKALHDGQYDCQPGPDRAQQIGKILSRGKLDYRTIWPKMELISCWMDAGARRFIAPLVERFPEVELQGKGLMSTEAIVTIPLAAAEHPVLAITSHFFEFMNENGELRICDELIEGEVYRLVVTTDGGLYRYDTGDRVRIGKPFNNLPTMEFVGRSGNISDLCGEKLSEQFLLSCLKDVTSFAMLAPVMHPNAHYALILDKKQHSTHSADRLANRLEHVLKENPHYDYARRIGQLKALKMARVESPLERYLGLMARSTAKQSSIKPPLLCIRQDWHILLEEWSDH